MQERDTPQSKKRPAMTRKEASAAGATGGKTKATLSPTDRFSDSYAESARERHQQSERRMQNVDGAREIASYPCRESFCNASAKFNCLEAAMSQKMMAFQAYLLKNLFDGKNRDRKSS